MNANSKYTTQKKQVKKNGDILKQKMYSMYVGQL